MMMMMDLDARQQQEILKVLIGGVDVVGVWFLYSRRLNRQTTLQSDERILGVGLGFATAESIVQRFLPLWINARGVEFNWSNIMTAIEANIQIVRRHVGDVVRYADQQATDTSCDPMRHRHHDHQPYYIAFATFVWLWSRTDLDKVSNPVVSAVLLTFAIIPVVFEYVVPASLACYRHRILTHRLVASTDRYVHSTGLYDDVSMLVLRGALTAFATAVGALLVSRYKSLRDKQHHVKSN